MVVEAGVEECKSPIDFDYLYRSVDNLSSVPTLGMTLQGGGVVSVLLAQYLHLLLNQVPMWTGEYLSEGSLRRMLLLYSTCICGSTLEKGLCCVAEWLIIFDGYH